MATLGAGPGPLGSKPDSAENLNEASKTLLNTYVHNYLISEGLTDIAKTLRGSRLQFKQELLSNKDSTDGDSKDDIVNRGEGGLNNIAGGAVSENFLPNWWAMFWDMWQAARRKEKSDTVAAQYLEHTQRVRQQQQSVMMSQQSMIGPGFAHFNPMQSRMGEVPRKPLMNNGRLPAGMNNMRMQQMGAQVQMQRDGSELEMNGAPRGQSPMPGENQPSPKRQRVDSGLFNPQMVQNGRPQGIGAQPPNGNAPAANMLMTAGFDPQNAMSPNFNQANGLPKNAAQQLYSQEMAAKAKNAMVGMPNGSMNLANMPQNSPMLAGPEGQFLPADLVQNGAANMRGNMGANGNGGALADYQMQLMLLEQQNKKRLMMARQEQDVAQRDQGAMGPQGLMGQPGFATSMSPRPSRTGNSPGSSDPTKRGTPKLGQESPLPDMGMRNSPGPMNFEHGQMPANMPPFTMVGGPNGMMVQPMPNQRPGAGPTPQQLEMMRHQQAQGMRMPNGAAWPPGMPNPGQMMPPGQVMQPSQIDGNMQRNNMAPPHGPANGRTQPPSPQPQAVAPPTPSQNNKAGPKKKETKDKPKKQTKKASTTTTGATPSEVEQADEVPPTPNTPKNPFAQVIRGQPNQQKVNIPPQPLAMPPSAPMGMGNPQDNSMVAPFGAMNDVGGDMPTFEFEDLINHDNTDVLHGFDFEAFLHNDPVPGFDFGGDPYLNGDTALDAMGE